MKKTSLDHMVTVLRICIVTFILCLLSLIIFSFTANKLTDDFFKQLGISKTDADKKISSSILGGYFSTYGTKNAVNLAVGNRVNVVKDLLAYTRQYITSEQFRKEYTSLKESHKPREEKVPTPEEFRKETIATYKKMVAEADGYLKTATKDTKAVFEKLLADSKKLLINAEDPENKDFAMYCKNYPGMLKGIKESYTLALQDWEAKYPTNQMYFVRQRLLQFLDETKDIDFTAALANKNGKKVFVESVYEQKGRYWKMGYRAGKDVVETARTFVQAWIAEIK